MNRLLALAASSLLVSVAAHAQGICLTTTPNYVSNNGGAAGGAVYFDVNVLNPNGISIKQLELNLWQANVNDPFDVDVYTIAGTGEGSETNMALWTLVSSGSGLVQPQDTPSPVDIADFALWPGTHGIALVLTGAGHRYTNGDTGLPWGSGGGNQFASNANLEILLGSASNIPFTGGVFQPRVWNGTICHGPGGSECFLLVGVRSWNFMLGSDPILVEPLLVIPMTLTNLPTIDVPNNNAFVGVSVFVQSFLYNPWYYPNDPIQVSDGLEYDIGVSTTAYGPPNTILMYPIGSVIAQPGGQIEIGFILP